MRKFEILYKHDDMPSEYRGYTLRWANDKAQAIKYLCPTKPDYQLILKSVISYYEVLVHCSSRKIFLGSSKSG